MPSVSSFSCFSFFSIFLRSRFCSQLSVGTYPSLSLYSRMACRYWPTPEILGVQRFSGAWSMGSTQRSGGRGANRFNSIGGSWYVIFDEVLEGAPAARWDRRRVVKWWTAGTVAPSKARQTSTGAKLFDQQHRQH